MEKLNDGVSRMISSSQAVPSVEILAKELLENSLDGGASRISIVLKKFGLEKIDVTDDGIGIKDMSFLRHGHSTSKINNFSDINQVKTFGFRGEVLSSVCSVSNLSIISKSDNDSSLGNIWVFDKLGNIISTSAVACNQGTTVSVVNIFQNLPVRRQMYKSLFVLQRTLKLMTRYIQQLYLCTQNVQIRLLNDNNIILNYQQSSGRKDSISTVIGTEKFNSFTEICESNLTKNGEEMKFHLFIPNYVNDKLVLSHSDYKEACNLFVNNRPAEVTSIFKVVRDVYSKYSESSRSRYPVCFLYIDVPYSWVDVNIDPNKRKIKIVNILEVIANLESHLKLFYESISNTNALNDADEHFNIAKSTENETAANINRVISSKKLSKHQEMENSFDDDDIREDKSVFSNSFYSNDNMDTSTEEVNEDCIKNKFSNNYKVNIHSHENAAFMKPASDFSLGRNQDIDGHPVKNFNLKRHVNDDDSFQPKSRKLKTNDDFLENKVITKNDSNDQPLLRKKESCFVKLCLPSLTNPVLYEPKNISQYNLAYLTTWKDFIVAIEENNHGSNDDEASHLLIFEKNNLIIMRTFVDQLGKIQIPAQKMENSFLIDEKYENIRQLLEKLPIQMISNSVSGFTYFIVSCPQLIKNGFRIHSIKKGDKNVFEIVSKPSFIEDINVLGEIIFITSQNLSDGIILRTESIRKWIFIKSFEIAEEKMNSEVNKLTVINESQYWNKCLMYMKKNGALNVLDFPDLIIFRHALK